MILAGDIGRTNTRFGCLEPKAGGGWDVHNYAKVKVTDFLTFDDALGSYLKTLDNKRNGLWRWIFSSWKKGTSGAFD